MGMVNGHTSLIVLPIIAFFENCYECYALLNSCFNYRPPNISSCFRCLTCLQYVWEELDYVAFNTGRCFDLDHIGSFQHFTRIKSGYVMFVKGSKPMLSVWIHIFVREIPIAFTHIIFL
ncbi:hypothetical protein MtrunA17_Chr1g0196641 [Medicago truncatula]|uniref:Transmembrane protein n=1 Tax=Medicago truncatula TaxID=3880 RepID=A0A396JYY8_MEDTR|nr:hypothetical protein MtrunA17_Chr1g0196641 [Medicago truncatula]